MTGYLLLAGCGHGLKTSSGHDDDSSSSDSLCQVKFELLQIMPWRTLHTWPTSPRTLFSRAGVDVGPTDLLLLLPDAAAW